MVNSSLIIKGNKEKGELSLTKRNAGIWEFLWTGRGEGGSFIQPFKYETLNPSGM